MNIQEERTFILDENNTAQQSLIDILDTLSPGNTRELHISTPLSGELDFSVLEKMGFKKVRSIHLAEGKVTDIIHIPKSVVELVCAHNILITLEHLPPMLTSLNCEHNHLSHLKVGGLDHLETLNCANNDLTELADLPESLVEINCEFNDISKLNLSGLERLETLNCANNKIMVLQNLPASLVDFKMANNPLTEVEHRAHSTKAEEHKQDEATAAKIGYLESLSEYFRLKDKYESKARILRRKAFTSAPNKKTGKLRAAKVVPPCINCGRAVGSFFGKVDEQYMAKCGDRDSPCNLHIQLFTSDFYRMDELLQSYREIVEESKENIIRLKLDTLFNYTSEKVSTDKFKKELHKYNEATALYANFMEEYEEVYRNKSRAELISRKTQEIQEILEHLAEMRQEYDKEQSPKLLTSLVETYIDDIMPKVEYLRQTRFPVMEMVEDARGHLHLTQREVPITKYDYAYTEMPKVIKFETK
jgi:Leucine-rich repeat (LRR) protein